MSLKNIQGVLLSRCTAFDKTAMKRSITYLIQSVRRLPSLMMMMPKMGTMPVRMRGFPENRVRVLDLILSCGTRAGTMALCMNGWMDGCCFYVHQQSV